MLLFGGLCDFLDLPLAEQGRGPDRPDSERPGGDDIDADRLRESLGFLDPGFGRPPRCLPRQLGHGNHRPFAPRDLDCAIAVEVVQDGAPSPESVPCSASRLSGFAGWSVDIACL